MTMPDPRPATYVIPCGADKASEPKPARDLYTGSMFRHTLAAVLADARYCEEHGIPARVLILSARHGLVELDQVIAPYDMKMGDDGCVDWVKLAVQAIGLGITYWDQVFAYLPRDYYARLARGLREVLEVYPVDVYELARGIGDQRHINAAAMPVPLPCIQGWLFASEDLSGPDGTAEGTRGGPAVPAPSPQPMASAR